MSKKFWVDFENAPHIPVLLPIVEKMQSLGYEPVMTARDFSFTKELVEKHHLPAMILGEGSRGKSSIGKAFRVAQRVVLLSKVIRPLKEHIAFSIAHASRSMLLTSHLLGITSVSLEDYEHSNQFHNSLSNFLLVPEPIPEDSFPRNRGKIIHYPGIKENIYLEGMILPKFIPDFILDKKEKTIVLFRPEGRTAHYRSSTSEALQIAILERLKREKNACLLVYPRDAVQRNELTEFLKDGEAEFVFPPIVDGPNLIASVDLVVGGGGTMTREAAVLGIPSYSFFSGEWGAVDDFLIRTGSLARIQNSGDIDGIRLVKRDTPANIPREKTTDFIVDVLLSIGKQ